MTLSIASLQVYPIKSLGGFPVNEARITDRGFEHDRRWMLVDGNGRFISQREVAALACLHCSTLNEGFRVTDVRDGDTIDLPWSIADGEVQHATVWNDGVEVLLAPMVISAWFAKKQGIACSLVFMPDATRREVDAQYANGITSLSDGYPYLIISQASLDDLNKRGATWAHGHMGIWAQVPMERFRPSIVIAGGEAYQEDGWKDIAIGETRFALVKPCIRCVITTTDQRTGERGKEPLRTLATYRRRKGEEGEVKVAFAMNAMAVSGRVVRVGDLVSA
ncbi:MAG: MOSC domain-containing protein [Flavobacteriales bacterium]|nr:MOSC domain-containing protein [Flavobacteriales bacterium]